MKSFVRKADIAGAIPKKLSGTQLDTQPNVNVSVTINLLMYSDATFIICPACERLMSKAWGWCPYHATAELIPLRDVDGDGSVKEEFVDMLMNQGHGQNTPPNPSVVGILEGPVRLGAAETTRPNRDRLLVHWSEFVIVK